MIMHCTADVSYRVVDEEGVTQGYFATKGLANQYIQKELEQKEKGQPDDASGVLRIQRVIKK